MAVRVQDVKRLLKGLGSLDQDARSGLIDVFRDWENEEIAADVAEKLLRGAVESYPAVDGWAPIPNEQLIRVLWRGAEFDPAVALDVFPKLDSRIVGRLLRPRELAVPLTVPRRRGVGECCGRHALSKRKLSDVIDRSQLTDSHSHQLAAEQPLQQAA